MYSRTSASQQGLLSVALVSDTKVTGCKNTGQNHKQLDPEFHVHETPPCVRLATQLRAAY